MAIVAQAGVVHQVALAGPGTHVIAIGIGAYDHVLGGSGPLGKHHLDLRQLSSPPVSARAVATWFIDHFECADFPLGSVALVLSEAVPAPFTNNRTMTDYTVPNGSMESVRLALKGWIARAEVDPRSRILLYFCGHGLSAGMQNFYLMRDYGADDDDPLQGAINFTNFKTGLGHKKPSSQFLLFDACRATNSLIDLNRDGGQPIFAADPAGRLGITETLQQCPIFSTELDRIALGRPAEPSLCAQAFIRAMGGACCRKEGNDWYVTTHRMVETLSDFQNRDAARGGRTQSADSASFARIRLRRLPHKPKIPVFVRIDTRALSPKVKLTAIRDTASLLCISDPSAPGWQDREEWEAELEIGDHDFRAEHLTDPAKTVTVSETVMPTFVEVTLQVAPWAP